MRAIAIAAFGFAWGAAGMRSHDADVLEGNNTRALAWYEVEGSKCTTAEKKKFQERFQVGKQYGRPCREESKWNSELAYENPKSPKTIALYIYPKEDHNNAFGFCEDGRFGLGFCHRVYSQSEHYSVVFRRVSSVEEAIEAVKGLPSDVEIKHLVLGGHGDPTSLQWGEYGGSGTTDLSVEDDTSDEFLDTVYPLLVKGERGATVFLDACLNGKQIDDKNMVQHVAHRLAGARVFASRISWDNDEFSLDSGKDFSGKIVSDRTGRDRMRVEKYGTGELRTWGFLANTFCDDKDSKARPGVSKLVECREACEAKPDCGAFVWYPHGNKLKENKCYLAKDCEDIRTSSKGAITFERPTSEGR